MIRSALLAAAVAACVAPPSAGAQDLNLSRLPRNYHLSEDGSRLVRARLDNARLYALDTVPALEFLFEEEDWFALVDSVGLLGSVVFEGDTLREVFIEVKGSSTDFGNDTRKKSFNVEVDAVRDDQDLAGYTSLNLHSGIFDKSHLREFLFYDLARRHLPAAQSNFVELHINGAPWGAYVNTQQIDKKFLRQWFFSAEGPRWRGEGPFGKIGGPDSCAAATEPARFAAYSGLLYRGRDTAAYTRYYSARGRHEPGSWEGLVEVIARLNLSSDEELPEVLPEVLAVDETLWFLAHENLLTDDDGYLFKTQSDFQLYIDPSTGQLTPIEYDGNGGFLFGYEQIPPTFRADETCVPLVNRLLHVPRWRQRYLAHYRTLLRERFDPAAIATRLEEAAALIDELEQRDSIGAALFTYEDFLSGRPSLNRVIAERYAYLDTLPELRASGIAVSEVGHAPAGAAPGGSRAIVGGEDYFVTAAVTGDVGEVYLHAAPDPRVADTPARFRENRMYDDGAHGDGAAGDGVYGARLTAQVAGALHRYYLEVTGATADAPSEFAPAGAEHETYYFVSASPTATALGPVRINELVADNETGATDESGEPEDWVEFYNDSDAAVDLSGYGFSDDPERPMRYTFPEGTRLGARSFLTLWVDDDEGDGDFHASFGLSRGGEALALVDAAGVIVDSVAFPELPTDSAYARRPDGAGAFAVAAPTFGTTNVPGASAAARAPRAYPTATLAPNPSGADFTRLRAPSAGLEVGLYNGLGQRLHHVAQTTAREVYLPTAGLPAGAYVVVVRGPEGTRALRLLRR